MRMRSPRIAPPVNGEDGSTATMPTVDPRRLYSCATFSARVDFPAPGGPVSPSTRARPVRGNRGGRRQGTAAPGPSAETGGGGARARPLPTRRPRLPDRSGGCRPRRPLRRAPPSPEPGTGSCLFRQQAPRDHEFLDFARSFADRAELHVAIELLDREVLDEPVAAVDLHGPIRRADGDLAR